jgi:hypothetical protein
MPKSRNRKDHKKKVSTYKQKSLGNKKEALRLFEEFKKTGVIPKFVVGSQTNSDPDLPTASPDYFA